MEGFQNQVEERISLALSKTKDRIKGLSRNSGVSIGEIVRNVGSIPKIWNLYYTSTQESESLIVEYHRDCQIFTGEEIETLKSRYACLPEVVTDIHGIEYIILRSDGSSRFSHTLNKNSPDQSQVHFQFRFDGGKAMCVYFEINKTMYMNFEKFWHELSLYGVIGQDSDLGETLKPTTRFELDLASREFDVHSSWIERMLKDHPEHFL